jgi:hypothetical protein
MEYWENGRLETEEGRRPGRSDSGLVFHGVHRKYTYDGKLAEEKFFIDDKECTKEEWAKWLKEHPEDAKFGT